MVDFNITFDKDGNVLEGNVAFSWTFGTCQGKKNVTYSSTEPSWLTVEAYQGRNDAILITTKPTTQVGNRNGDVIIKLNGSGCTTIAVTQNGTGCECTTAFVPVAIGGNIPVGGGNNITLGNYTYSADCITISPNGSSNANWIRDIRVSNGTIIGNVEGNPNKGSRGPATITVSGQMKSDSSWCTPSLQVSQDGTGCECNPNTFGITTTSPIQIGADGGALSFNYRSDENCITSVTNPTITYTPSSVSDWITNLALAANKTVTGTVISNGATDQRSATITIKGVMKDSSECLSSIVVQQAGIDCSCDNLSIPSVINSIPTEGLAVDSEIATYTILNGCNKTNYTSKLIERDSGTEYNVELDNNGKVILKTAVPKAERDSDTKYFDLKFYYNGAPCDELTIELGQISIPCSCESINYFVRSLKITFPISGTGANYVDVASGNTYGCGYLSAVTTNELLEGGELVIEQVNEFEYLFKGKVLPYTGENRYRTADVRMFFKRRDETEFQDCDRVIHLVQSDEYCDCKNGKMWVLPYSSHSDDISCGKKYNMTVATSYCATISATTDDDWITFNDNVGKKVTVNIEENSGLERTGYIYVTSLIDYEKDWNSGVVCETETIKIVQKECNVCDCYELNPRAYYDQCRNVDWNHTGDSFVNYIVTEGENTCKGELYMPSDEEIREPENGDYRPVFCGWYTTDGNPPFWITPWEDEKDYFLNAAGWIEVHLNINSENALTEDRSVEIKIGIEYYKDGYWYGGCWESESQCQLYLCLIQKGNICKDCNKVSFKQRFDPLPCIKSYDNIAYTYDGDVCNITMSGYTSDENGNPMTYDWIEVKEKETLDTACTVNYAANEDDEDRTAYVYVSLVDADGIPYCGKNIRVSQEACVTICNCDSYNLNVYTTGYGDEFEDGSGAHAVARIPKNYAECLSVYPQTQQSAYIDVYLQNIDENEDYCEVIANIKDKDITTDVAVSIDIIVFDDEIRERCDEATIHIKIKPKS